MPSPRSGSPEALASSVTFSSGAPLAGVALSAASGARFGGATSVKSTGETLKNSPVLQRASTRPCVVARLGSSTLSAPSFGVADRSTRLKREPALSTPSSTRSTLAQDTGVAVVPATSQLTGSVAPALKRAPTSAGVSTRNGPARSVTLTTRSALPTPPASVPSALAARPSRTTKRKFRSRATSGRLSPSRGVPSSTSAICGNVRVGDVLGANERNSGAVASGAFGAPAAPRSNCSH